MTGLEVSYDCLAFLAHNEQLTSGSRLQIFTLVHAGTGAGVDSNFPFSVVVTGDLITGKALQ